MAVCARDGIARRVAGLRDAGQAHEIIARGRDFAAIFVDQQLAERDDILRLGIEQADGLDVLVQAGFA